MAFIVEDGSGVVGANSYLSVEDANAYHKDRGNAGWQGAGSQKQVALVRATAYIEATYLWSTGYKADGDQGLSWPRFEAVDVDGFGIGEDVVPEKVQHAVAEVALKALTEDLFPAQDRETSSESVGPLSVSYVPGASRERRFPFIDRLLRGLAVLDSNVSGFMIVDVERS